eukprot:snap_masked-scaffold_6-processed-gene-12.19-mRNA-1 protein AED:1.00 eAED:1.00 QI:0/-1/0/0/-1/1/1/0/442
MSSRSHYIQNTLSQPQGPPGISSYSSNAALPQSPYQSNFGSMRQTTNPDYSASPAITQKEAFNKFEEEKKSSGTKSLIFLCLVLVVVVSAGALLFVVNPGNVFLEEESSGSSPSPQPELVPTPFPISPTVPLTLRPTVAPTPYPTTGSPTVTTPFPTDSPTLPTPTPTESPQELCQDPDAECGCFQVRSTALDLFYIVDESGSVGEDNYDIQKEALVTFTRQAFSENNDTRFSYLEFDNAVESGDRIFFSDSDNAEEFIDAMNARTYTPGSTSQRAALEAVRDMLESTAGAPRAEAQLSLMMFTDGNPCNTGGNSCNNEFIEGTDCCADSVDTDGGIPELRALADDFNFSFFFLPITPETGGINTINIGLYDSVVGPDGTGSQGLAEEDYVVLNVSGFDQLSQVLNRSQFNFPLGPCVAAPTASGGERILEWEESLDWSQYL